MTYTSALAYYLLLLLLIMGLFMLELANRCYLPPGRALTFPPLPQPKLVVDFASPEEECKLS